ncbi:MULTISPECIES: HEAT repeat domain-containing protein [Okeania]|uniref:HEAT repeat domain-containing protein n=1 Tax=Okeania hirsuta TaxID=1458930 RepID=A0A3N6R4G6_9CYAN|nr:MULTISPECIES: HEAT repeat domain-containing protein [Okeania]NET16615.1 HEAT repeat domain-containing protein [Okeania sp. SIO1H6]NES76003.1 HEAT repeat domain-containing protein [Okeania sp. SIO1H4]NES89506.1 HEAT repeat domain-containing protein [Okeania sp. SIO2B9]NET19545.1 HEAT repeat domain-containing protein [Okeania sp. SIO1H5]NET75753.1 HEAT repeat domain-containing protein [Okeania sp. SIO1F9]
MTQSSLFEKLKHPNPHLRDRAMWEIVETCDETTIPNLMEVLAEEDTVYRRAAVKALGAIGTDTVPFLVDSLLNSDNSTIRSSCAKALAQVAINYKNVPFPSEGIEGLKKGLSDTNPVVHIASAMALGVIGVPALDSLLEVLDGTENLGLAVAILNAVSSINDERSKAVLTKLANDASADTYVRETAISALSRLDMLNFKPNRS